MRGVREAVQAGVTVGGRAGADSMSSGMEVDGGDLQEVRIGKRVFVGNLAWRTSWQDLKVGRACML